MPRPASSDQVLPELRNDSRTTVANSSDICSNKLARLANRYDDAVARVASLVHGLRELPSGIELAPDGFDELWHVVL